MSIRRLQVLKHVDPPTPGTEPCRYRASYMHTCAFATCLVTELSQHATDLNDVFATGLVTELSDLTTDLKDVFVTGLVSELSEHATDLNDVRNSIAQLFSVLNVEQHQLERENELKAKLAALHDELRPYEEVRVVRERVKGQTVGAA